MRREVFNVSSHRRMPEVFEVEVKHLLKRFFCGPMQKGDTVSGEEHAGAVVAQPAMHVKLFCRMLLKKGEELNEFVIRGRRPAARGDIHEVHAKSFHPLAFLFHRAWVLSAKVNDGRDSKLFELFKTFRVWLRAAVQRTIELADVRHPGNLHSFAEASKLHGLRFTDGDRSSRMRGMRTSVGEHQPEGR